MELRIVVCIKSVMLSAPSTGMVRTEETSELNPYDRPALEAAIRLRERHGGSVTALTMGPESSLSALSEARAMGVDREILISDPAFAGSDTIATSLVLGAALKKLLPFDLVFFGVRTADSDTGQVGPQTAALMDLPFVGMVRDMAWQENEFHVERVADHFVLTYAVRIPAVLSIDAGANTPRDIGLSGIEETFKSRKTKKWGLAELGLSLSEVGDAGSPTRVISMSKVQKDKLCEFIEGDNREQADVLVRRLVRMGIFED